MLPTFKSFYNNVFKTLKESVSFNDLPTFDKPNTIYKHITVENGEKIIRGNVDFSYKNLTKLPDLSDVKVFGCFICYHNQLQTLEGAPKYVGGYFSCSRNKLQTLEGAPEYVGDSFGCIDNQLQTLEGAPEYVGGSFGCDHNQLQTLEGAPERVGRNFSCSRNKLQTLEGAPEYVGGDFNCEQNPQLKTLKGAPERVGIGFYCGSNNQLQTLEGAPKHVDGHFYCERNPQLTTLKGLPKFIGGDLCWSRTEVSMEDFYENLLLSDVKGNPMARSKYGDDSVYPTNPMSNEEAYATAGSYKIYNTPSEDIDF